MPCVWILCTLDARHPNVLVRAVVVCLQWASMCLHLKKNLFFSPHFNFLIIEYIHYQAFSFRGRILFFSCWRSEFISVFGSCLQPPVQNALGFANFQPPFFWLVSASHEAVCLLASTGACTCVLYTFVCDSLGEARTTGLRALDSLISCLCRGLAPGEA